MVKKIIPLLIAAAFFASSATATVFQVDPNHTQIHFSVQHLVFFKVRGNFNDFTGTIEAEPDSGQLISAEATIKAASIDTRKTKRDKHLRSPDFFAVEEYPEIRFQSTKITGSGDDITVHGDLTIRGITKKIVLNGAFLGAIKGPKGKLHAGFEASGTINRKDFGLNWNKLTETGGVVVGDQVEIGLEFESVKAEG